MSSMIISDYLIITSRKDIAGMNMKKILKTKLDFKEDPKFQPDENWEKEDYQLERYENIALLTLPHSQIYSDYLKDYLETKLIIFASKHSSATGKKTLLVHPTGLWGDDESHGGKARTLSKVDSYAITHAYSLIRQKHSERKLDRYVVGLEATHHGPTNLKSPLLFIETGGSLDEWSDLEACELIVDCIIDLIHALEIKPIVSKTTMIGIGGGHYAPTFMRRLNEGMYHLGHIIPKFVHENLTEDLLLQAWNKTISQDKIFLIDKKGCKGPQRRRIIQLIEKLNLPWKYS